MQKEPKSDCKKIRPLGFGSCRFSLHVGFGARDAGAREAVAPFRQFDAVTPTGNFAVRRLPVAFKNFDLESRGRKKAGGFCPRLSTASQVLRTSQPNQLSPDRYRHRLCQSAPTPHAGPDCRTRRSGRRPRSWVRSHLPPTSQRVPRHP